MSESPAPLFRVTLTGPESTGKSTLAAELANWYGAPTSAEAARLLADARRAELLPNTPPEALLGPEDVGRIARAQVLLEVGAEARARARGARLAIRDTDLISTVVYARHYYGACQPWIEQAARERRADLYLLCDVDLPWVADGQRDRPHAREELHAEFARALEEFGCDWALVGGEGPLRTAVALAAVDRLLASRAGA